jgi:hypothetical protein
MAVLTLLCATAHAQVPLNNDKSDTFSNIGMGTAAPPLASTPSFADLSLARGAVPDRDALSPVRISLSFPDSLPVAQNPPIRRT